MSFDNAEIYYKATNYNKILTKVLVEEYYDWIDWRNDGRDSLLDIGSGPGNIVREEIYPLLLPNFSRLVCSDVSKAMVELQREEFQGIPRVTGEVLDIGKRIDGDLAGRLGTFDHVTSFFCLMWVKDQQTAVDNIFRLLKPGGDCFLAIVADSPLFDALLSVCEKPKWKDYFTGWEDFYVFPYRKLNEAKVKGLKFMANAGFVDLKAELKRDPFKLDCDEQKENLLRSMPNKFSREVSPEVEEEIYQERLRYFDRFNLGKYRDNTDRIEKPSTYLILYGKKEDVFCKI